MTTASEVGRALELLMRNLQELHDCSGREQKAVEHAANRTESALGRPTSREATRAAQELHRSAEQLARATEALHTAHESVKRYLHANFHSTGGTTGQGAIAERHWAVNEGVQDDLLSRISPDEGGAGETDRGNRRKKLLVDLGFTAAKVGLLATAAATGFAPAVAFASLAFTIGKYAYERRDLASAAEGEAALRHLNKEFAVELVLATTGVGLIGVGAVGLEELAHPLELIHWWTDVGMEVWHEVRKSRALTTARALVSDYTDRSFVAICSRLSDYFTADKE